MATVRVRLAALKKQWEQGEGTFSIRFTLARASRLAGPAGVAMVAAEVLARARDSGGMDAIWDRAAMGSPSALDDGSAAVSVSKVDTEQDFDDLMTALAAAIEEQGVGGELGGFRPASPPYAAYFSPTAQHFMGLTVAVNPVLRADVADRPSQPPYGRKPMYWSGDIDPDVLSGVLAHALAWCDLPGGTHYQMTGATRVQVDPAGREERWRWGLQQRASTWVECADWPREARRVVIDHQGRMVYQFGYGVGHGDGLAPQWILEPAALKHAAGLLADLAPLVDYGLVLRHPYAWVGRDSELDDQWPPLPQGRDVGLSLKYTRVQEARVVPDAFGMQLLGPGHDLTGATLTDWHLSELTAGRRLLAHRQPAAFFPPGPWRPGPEMPLLCADSRPDPEVHARARHDLAPLIATADDFDAAMRELNPND